MLWLPVAALSLLPVAGLSLLPMAGLSLLLVAGVSLLRVVVAGGCRHGGLGWQVSLVLLGHRGRPPWHSGWLGNVPPVLLPACQDARGFLLVGLFSARGWGCVQLSWADGVATVSLMQLFSYLSVTYCCHPHTTRPEGRPMSAGHIYKGCYCASKIAVLLVAGVLAQRRLHAVLLLAAPSLLQVGALP